MPSRSEPLPFHPLVIGLGEAVWDAFPDARRPGGAPGNVAHHVGQLGGRALVGSRFGRDEEGRDLAAQLQRTGLDLSVVQWDDDAPTGKVTVHLEDAAHPYYAIHQPAAWDNLEPTPELLQAARESNAICFGTLAQRSPVARETIYQVLDAAQPSCLTVYDVNLRQQFYARDWIERSLTHSRIAKINNDEVAIVAPLLELPSELDRFAAAVIERFNMEAVCVTRAAEGCLVASAEATLDIPGESVLVADTVGAGDAFTAALIVALCNQWPLERAARFANRIGGIVATKVGATPQVAEEYRACAREFSV
jgi:fructokinase